MSNHRVCKISKKCFIRQIKLSVVRTIKLARLFMLALHFDFSRILVCFLQRILLLSTMLSTDFILRFRDFTVKNPLSRIKTKTNQRENFKSHSKRIKNSSKIVKNFVVKSNKPSQWAKKILLRHLQAKP